MLSYRSFHSPELEFCRRSERGITLQLAHAGRNRDHYNSGDRLSERTSPTSDSEGRSGGPPRKRVPVACGRCRKRKIKCSGDNGTGACSNCTSSGAVNQCQFLRVNSLSQEILPHPSPKWQMGVRYSPYSANHPSSRHNSFTLPHAYSGSGHCSITQPSYEYNPYGGSTQGTTWARSHNGAAYTYSCDDETPLHYSNHPAYLLPNAESATTSTGYLSSLNSSRAWSPVTQINRVQQAPAYADQPVANSITPMGSQFASYDHRQTTMPSDVAFPGILSSHTNMITNDRMLPDPAASRSHSASKITSIESVPVNLLHRSSSTWMEGIPASSHSSGSRTLSIGLSDGSDSTARSVTSLAPQDMDFGFIPISNSPQEGSIQSTAVGTATETSQSAFEYSKTPLADYRRDRCRTLSHESDASAAPDEAVAEGYGYSSEARNSRQSIHHSSSSGQLSNGQEYTRLRQEPSSQINLAMEEYRQQHSSVYETNLPNRASIASINNSSGY